MADFIYNQKASTYNDHLVNYAGELGLFKKDLSKLQEILHNQGVDIEDGKFSKLVDKLEARMESIEKRESGTVITSIYGEVEEDKDRYRLFEKINIFKNKIYVAKGSGFCFLKISEPIKNLSKKDTKSWTDDYNYKNYIMSTDKKRYYEKNDAIYSDLITSNPGYIVKCEAVDFSKPRGFKFTQNYIIPPRAEKNGSFPFFNLKTSTVQKANIPSISTKGVVPLPMDLVEMEKDDETKILLDLKTNTFIAGEWVKKIFRNSNEGVDCEYLDSDNNKFIVNVKKGVTGRKYADIKISLSNGKTKIIPRSSVFSESYSEIKIKGGVICLEHFSEYRDSVSSDVYDYLEIIKPSNDDFGYTLLLREWRRKPHDGRYSRNERRGMSYIGDYIIFSNNVYERKIISTGYEKEGR